MVREKDLEKIESIEKKVTKHDLAIYDKLHILLRQVYKLELKDKVKLYDKIKAKEKEVLKVIKHIRKDTVKELRFAQILRPKNKFQKAIVDIFGPFLSPEPVAVARTEYVLNHDLGVEGLGVGPNGQPFLTLHGQDFTFGQKSYADGGNPDSNLKGFGPALARAEGLDGPEAQARQDYASSKLKDALHGVSGPVEYRPAIAEKGYQPAQLI